MAITRQSRWSSLRVIRVCIRLTFRSTGTPQIILPLWVDLYNFAQLAEQVGVGVWGCRATSPDWTAECLSQAIITVADKGHAAFKSAATNISDAYQRRGRGRDVAASIIAQLARSGKGEDAAN